MNRLALLIFLSIIGPIIGSLIGVIRKPSQKAIFGYLAFAAGIMIGVSVFRLIPEGYQLGSLILVAEGLLAGLIIMVLVEYLIPHIHISTLHHGKNVKMQRTAISLIIGLLIHNLPEGMAIGINSTANINLSLAVALAIAIHDIPEGICSSAPYYRITGRRLHSFLISSATAIPTLIGFIISYYLLSQIANGLLGFLVSATAGIMLYMSFFELIPASHFTVKSYSRFAYFFIGILLVSLLTIFR